VTRPHRSDERAESDAPEVPGFRTWRGLYLFVFGWFVLLTVFTEIFS
jgi:hypothetical protein